MADDIKVIIGVDSAPVKRAVQLMNNLESEVRDVERAERKGLITRQRAAAETKRLTDQMSRLKQVSAGSAKDFYSFEKSLVGSGKMARRNEVAFQQAGYQIQDFIVQVQAGTNPLIAFSQQGSQLAGFFAGPWGAMIGLGIAAVSSLGMALMAVTGKAKETKDIMSDLTSAASDYTSAIKDSSSSMETLNSKFGSFAPIAKNVLATMLEIKKVKFDEAINAVAEGAGFADPKSLLGKQMKGFQVKTVTELFPELDKLRTQARNKAAADFVTVLGQFDAAVGEAEQLKALQALKQEVVSIAGDYKGMNDTQRAFYDSIATAEQALVDAIAERGAAEAENRRLSEQNQLDMIKVFRDAQKRMREEDEETRRLREENQLSMIEVFRAAQKRMRDEQAATDAEIAKGYANSLGFSKQLTNETDAYVKSAVEGFRQTEKLKEKLGDAAYEALRLAGVDMKSGISSAAKEAAKLAASLGISLTAAVNLQNLRDSKTYSGRGGDPRKVNDYTSELGYETVDEVIASLTKTKSGGAKKKDPLAELKKRITLEEQLFGKTEAQRQVIQALGVDYKETYGESATKDLITRIEKIQELQDEEAKLEDISNIISSSMGEAFMSIVDGTKSAKDAFKDMARSIIARLYEILVVEQLVNSIAGSIMGGFGGGGGAPSTSLRPQARPFADGGVVGGPTFFPMAGGQTGLMGEAGPEAIMPLKRGANGKLGVQVEGKAGGDVNIVQNFSFSANGDDSVKKLIAQAAPQIANMTQKQIMDSRRRGGAMKSTFG